MARESIVGVVDALLGYVEQGSTFMTDRVVEIPSKNYTDPARWEREMALIFKRVPVLVAASSELKGPGSYKAMDYMGLPLLVTRDGDGQARVFLNVCSHRGATLAPAGHGKCNRFSCPYHGWSFANDGRLVAVADARKFGDVDKSKLGLRALPSYERAGLIFAVLTPGLETDFEGFFAGALEDYEHAGLKDWAFIGQRVIHGANWKVAYDGYLEGYHFASLHPKTIYPRTFGNLIHYEAFGPHLRCGYAQVSIKEKMQGVPREQWPERETQGFDFVRTLFPNVSIFMAPEITQIAQLLPGPTADRNTTVLTFLRKDPPRDAEDAAGLETMMNWLRDVVNDEDYAIGLKIQQGLESGAFEHITLGRNERGNQFFHEWVDWYLANDPQRPKPVL